MDPHREFPYPTITFTSWHMFLQAVDGRAQEAAEKKETLDIIFENDKDPHVGGFDGAISEASKICSQAMEKHGIDMDVQGTGKNTFRIRFWGK